MSRLARLLARTIPAVIAILFALPAPVDATPSLAPNQQSSANAALNREAVRALTAWAENEGVPYRNIEVTDVDSDGVFATVGAQLESRASRTAGWQAKTLMLECSKVGTRWRCDDPVLIEYAMIGQVFDEGSRHRMLAGMRPDGSVSPLGSNDILRPALSPRGDRIAVARETSNNDDYADDDYQIEILDLKGNEIQALDGIPFPNVGALVWSPDGGSLAIVGLGGEEDESSLMIWEIGTGNTSMLLSQNTDGMIAWSPDGQQIAFVGDVLELLDTVSGDATRIVEDPSFSFGSDDSVSWSYDGRYLLFQRRSQSGGKEVWVYEGATGESQLICGGNLECIAPGWFPDSHDLLLFRQELGASGTIYDSRFVPSRVQVPTLATVDFPYSYVQVLSYTSQISPDGTFAALEDSYSDVLMRLSDGHLWELRLANGQWHPRMSALELTDEGTLFCPPTQILEQPALLIQDAYYETNWVLDVQGNCAAYPFQHSEDAAFSNDLDVMATYLFDTNDGTRAGLVTFDVEDARIIHTFSFDLTINDRLNLRILGVTPTGDGILWQDGESAFYWAESGSAHARILDVLSPYPTAALSPDGTMIAGCVASGEFYEKLAIYDIESATTTILRESPTFVYCPYVGWTDDSQSVYSSHVPQFDFQNHPQPSLWILDVISGSITVFESGNDEVTSSTLSPDGEWFAFIAHELDSDLLKLRVQDLQSGEYVLQLVVGSESDGSLISYISGSYWSSNGHYLALASNPYSTGYATYVIEVATGTIWHIPEVTGFAHWYPNVEEINFPDEWIVSAIGETGQ